MNRRSLIIVAGVTALAVASGITMALLQTPPQNPLPSNSISTRTMSPQSSPSPSSPPPERNSPAQPMPIAEGNPPTTIAASAQREPVQRELVRGEPSREVQSCRITMAVVDDPQPPLNVRSSPTTAAQNIVGQVNNGTYLTVAQEQDGWLQITEPAGWVAKSRTQSGCNEKVEQVQFGAGNTGAEISDRFVGTGFHQYLLTARAGQTLTITRQSGPIPFVVTPAGQVLTETSDSGDRWSGKLPLSGDYALQLDSNYKGYSYSFVVEIQQES